MMDRGFPASSARAPSSASTAYRPGGSGLGLSIVGRVVELLAGDIELSEPACGSGLIVTVCLPFRTAA
jgi:signal transduction histidine kinase